MCPHCHPHGMKRFNWDISVPVLATTTSPMLIIDVLKPDYLIILHAVSTLELFLLMHLHATASLNGLTLQHV